MQQVGANMGEQGPTWMLARVTGTRRDAAQPHCAACPGLRESGRVCCAAPVRAWVSSRGSCGASLWHHRAARLVVLSSHGCIAAPSFPALLSRPPVCAHCV